MKDYALLFILILFIVEIICIILYISKYIEIFDPKYKQLTRDIYKSEIKKSSEILEEFEKIFGTICKTLICIELDFREFFTILFCILIIIFSGIGSFSSRYCSKTFGCKVCCVIILIISGVMNVYNIDSAFSEDGKNLYSKYIYFYDEDLNNRMREALNMIHIRSLYLKTTSIMILIIIIAIIPNLCLIKTDEDNIPIQNQYFQDINYMQNDFNNNNHYNNQYNNQNNNQDNIHYNNQYNNPLNNSSNNPLINQLTIQN